LIYHTDSNAPEVASGQLTGLARDQDEVTVEVDVEARQYSLSGQRVREDRTLFSQVNVEEEARRFAESLVLPSASRQLREILTHSTERYLMASDGADDDYYRELQLMGYENEVVRDQVTNRGREYHGMLHVGCKRVVQVCRSEWIS